MVPVVVAAVIAEALLIFGGLAAAEPAPRECTAAGADARLIMEQGWVGSSAPSVGQAWSVPVRLADGGRLIGVEVTSGSEPAAGRYYFWTDVTGPLDRNATVLAFGEAIDDSSWPAAGDRHSPVEVIAGEIMFDAQRPLDRCFEAGRD